MPSPSQLPRTRGELETGSTAELRDRAARGFVPKPGRPPLASRPMEALKGLILSGGAGTRLRPITHTSAKQLVPVANKPVLFYGIEALVDAGIDGDRDHHRARDRRRDPRGGRRRLAASAPRSPTSRRTSPAGLAHAVLTAEDFLGDSPFVMYLGDNLLRDGITDLVDAFREHEPEALILLTQVPDPWHYGVAELDGDSRRPPGREAEGPAERHGAGRRLHVHAGDLRRRARRSSPRGAASSRSPTRSSSLIDGGSRVESHTVERLVEGHRPARRHARGQPAGARGPRAPDRGRARRREPGRGPGGDRGRREARALGGPRPGRDRRRRADHRLLRRALHVDRRRTSRSIGSEVEHSILLAGASVSDLAARIEASLLGKRRQARARRGDAEDAADDRRRQRRRSRSREPRVAEMLITGAGGMLGRDTVDAVAARGHAVIGLAAPSSTSPTPRAVEDAIAELRPDAVVNCAAWTDVDGAEARRARAMRVNDTAAGIVSATAAAHGAERPLRLQRLRLRRLEGPRLRRVRPAGRDLRLRALQAGRRDLDRRSPTRATSSSARRGCSAPAARTSSRRCCASASSSRR